MALAWLSAQCLASDFDMKRRFPRLAPLLLLAALAAACTSAKQLAERNNERCVARGYTPGTDAFADCVVRIEGEGQARMERNRREMMERPGGPPPIGPMGQ
jgi:hypothetical protein